MEGCVLGVIVLDADHESRRKPCAPRGKATTIMAFRTTPNHYDTTVTGVRQLNGIEFNSPSFGGGRHSHMGRDTTY